MYLIKQSAVSTELALAECDLSIRPGTNAFRDESALYAHDDISLHLPLASASL